MITITRRLAQQFRAVLRRAFGQVRVGPVIGFIAGAEGLTVKSMSADAAVELRVPGARAAECPVAAVSGPRRLRGEEGRSRRVDGDRQRPRHGTVARRQRAADRPVRLGSAA